MRTSVSPRSRRVFDVCPYPIQGLVRHCRHESLLEQCHVLVAGLGLAGHDPDRLIFNDVIAVAAEVGRMDEALALLKEVR